MLDKLAGNVNFDASKRQKVLMMNEKKNMN